jgi:predicted esterase
MHGLGDSAEGFLDVFNNPEYNVVPDNCKVLLLTAPERAVSMNGGMKMNSWYDIMQLGAPPKKFDEIFDRYN